MASYYDQLGIRPDASTEQIKRAYRALARRYHPDVDPSQNAAAHFKQVSEAYAVLSDPRNRLAYNHSILTAVVHSPTTTNLPKRELWAAWQRVSSYATTGGLLALLGLASARWLGGTQPIWAVAPLWPSTVIGILLGTLWGIDANFVIADFVSRTMLWGIRVGRFVGWTLGLRFLLLAIEQGASIGRQLPTTVTVKAEFGVIALGLCIAIVATARDH